MQTDAQIAVVQVLDPIRNLFKSATGKMALVAVFSVLLLLPLIVLAAPAQETAGYVVISEVQSSSADGTGDDDDWIELYNPTDQAIDLADKNYRIEKAMTAADPSIVMRIGHDDDGTYPGGTTIPAHGFYLVVRDDASETLRDKADAIGTKSSFTWTGTGYTLYLGNNVISSDDDPDIVDKVGFGTATYYEGSPASAIPDAKSIERKAQSTSISETMKVDGADEFRGNGYDSDNNNLDFVLRDSPQPQNSASLREPGPPATVTVSANPTSITANGSSTSTITAIVTDTYDNPVDDGTIVTFTTDLGSVGSQQVTKTTTSGVASATLTSTTSAGTATITATAASKFATTTVEFTAVASSAPATVTLTASPTAIPADDASTSTITATIVDQDSNDVDDGTIVTFTTDLGSVGSSTVTKITTGGVATATLTAGPTPGVAVVTATAGSASDQITVTLFQRGLASDSVKTKVLTGSGTVDNVAGANTKVVITAAGDCTTTVVSGRYTDDPGGAPNFTAFTGGYIDVQIPDSTCASQVEIRLYYPKDTSDEHSLRLYWWDGTSWRECSHQGVNTADVNGYGGYLWVQVRGDTFPALTDMTGTPFGGGHPPRPVGGTVEAQGRLGLLSP